MVFWYQGTLQRLPTQVKQNMGLCGSSLSEEEKASRALTQQANADHAAEKRKIKLLLLGG